jgi:hypothetical protein
MQKIPTISGLPFCEVSSENEYSCNLQLVALREAFIKWRGLKDPNHLSQAKLTEQLASVLTSAGESVSRLMGQNVESKQSRVKPPKALFTEIFGANHPKKNQFYEFIDVYDASRHFGPPKHAIIAALSPAKCEEYLSLVVSLWDEIVQKYIAAGKDPNHALDGFRSVRDLI